MSTAKQVREYRGPAILSYGFRPFFLAGAAWAAVAMCLWLPMLGGHISLPTTFSPIEWHVHELVYGYVPAIVAGFLLTAVPNWTGRLPVVGLPLLALFLIWLAGRLAISLSAWTGLTIACAIDALFLAALGLAVAREIIAGKNWRNLKILLAIVFLLVGNVVFHLEVQYQTNSGYGLRLGIAAIILLIMLIGGRIIPSFTRNWLSRRNAGRLPVPFGRFDAAIVIASGFAMISWIIAPEHTATAVFLTVAALLNLTRLTRWAGERTAAEPLVLILHIAYAFVPAGFALLAGSIWWPDLINHSGAVHGWTAGAIPLMTLAVMTRASLGHTGRQLTAGLATTTIYIVAFAAACMRIMAAFELWTEPMLLLSGLFWIIAFGGFVCAFGPLLAVHARS